MAIVGRAGEALARSINRRLALKQAAAAVFGAVAAFSVDGLRRNSALADHCRYVTSGDCGCNPPYGTYCTELDSSFCSGSTCSGGCEFDESWRYVGACWCSATCGYDGDGGRVRGYYKCCDCNCYGSACGCREFIEGESEHAGTGRGGSNNLPSFPNRGGNNSGGSSGMFPDGFPNSGSSSGTGSQFPTIPASNSGGGGVEFPSGFPFDN